MSAASHPRFVAERAQSLLRLSGDIHHWDGVSLASRGVGPPSILELVTYAAFPQPMSDWATEAARMIFYLDPVLLLPAPHEAIPAVTGVLVWVSPGAPGESRTATPHPALLVQTASAARPVVCVVLVPHLPVDDPILQHMTLMLQVACRAENAAGRLYAAALADALALHFLRRYAACRHTTPEARGGLPPAKLRRTIEYIQTHLVEKLSLTTLAAVAHLSPDHFARLFKQSTGRTPHQYVLWCRIERAKQLLSATDMPLCAVGMQVGCTDQSAFTALFRKHVSMTPKTYRDATQRT